MLFENEIMSGHARQIKDRLLILRQAVRVTSSRLLAAMISRRNDCRRCRQGAPLLVDLLAPGKREANYLAFLLGDQGANQV